MSKFQYTFVQFHMEKKIRKSFCTCISIFLYSLIKICTRCGKRNILKNFIAAVCFTAAVFVSLKFSSASIITYRKNLHLIEQAKCILAKSFLSRRIRPCIHRVNFAEVTWHAQSFIRRIALPVLFICRRHAKNN